MMNDPSKLNLPSAPNSNLRVAFGPQAELILERLDADIVQLTLVVRTSFGWEMLGRQTLSLVQLQDLPLAALIPEQAVKSLHPNPNKK